MKLGNQAAKRLKKLLSKQSRVSVHKQLVNKFLNIFVIDLRSKNEVEEFFDESILMMDFKHPNILGLAGVCFDTPDGVPFIILPFMANGSLKDYLKNKRTHLTNVDTLPEVKCVQ